jgi:hypothetical protein
MDAMLNSVPASRGKQHRSQLQQQQHKACACGTSCRVLRLPHMTEHIICPNPLTKTAFPLVSHLMLLPTAPIHSSAAFAICDSLFSCAL